MSENSDLFRVEKIENENTASCSRLGNEFQIIVQIIKSEEIKKDKRCNQMKIKKKK
jgi:hypothetical protein